MNQSSVAGGGASQTNLAVLRSLSRQFPTVDSALAEAARLSGELVLPRGTIHIVSDVHGEYKKLRHIINNASGTLRPLVERLFAEGQGYADLEPMLTRERHRHAMAAASDELRAASELMEALGEPVLVAHHVRLAVLALDEVIGVVDIEDVLDRVFSRFCVGK